MINLTACGQLVIKMQTYLHHHHLTGASGAGSKQRSCHSSYYQLDVSSYNTKILVQQVPQVARCSHSMKEALTLSPRVATLSAGSARKCCLPRLVSATTSSSSSSKGSRREDMVRHSSHVRRPPSSHTHCHVLSQVTGERKHQCPCSLLVRCEAGRPLCCRAEQVPLFAESARLAPARCSCTTP